MRLARTQALVLIGALWTSLATSTPGEVLAQTTQSKTSLKEEVISAEAKPGESFFNDIKVGSPYLVQLRYLHDRELIHGYEDGSFQPNKPITRLEGITLINQALKNNSKSATAALASGESETTISRPTETLNLAEAVKLIIMAELEHDPELKLPEKKRSAFKDVKRNDWFAPYIDLANKKTLLSYTTKMLIKPAQPMTRGAFADLIYRALRTREPGHFFGRGSFYSDFFEGRGTSNGEKYRQKGYTAAHKTLPFLTKLKVTYLRNGQTVEVRVNDRGPFTPSMDLDLTRQAFTELANTSEGIIPIEYEIVSE